MALAVVRCPQVLQVSCLVVCQGKVLLLPKEEKETEDNATAWEIPNGLVEREDFDCYRTAVRVLYDKAALIVLPDQLVMCGQSIEPKERHLLHDTRFRVWFGNFPAVKQGEWVDCREVQRLLGNNLCQVPRKGKGKSCWCMNGRC